MVEAEEQAGGERPRVGSAVRGQLVPRAAEAHADEGRGPAGTLASSLGLPEREKLIRNRPCHCRHGLRALGAPVCAQQALRPAPALGDVSPSS